MRIRLGWIISVMALMLLFVMELIGDTITPIIWICSILLMFLGPFMIEDINIGDVKRGQGDGGSK